MLNMTFSEYLQKRMAFLNLRQIDIKKATGASKGTVSLWVSGDALPSVKFAPELAKILLVNDADLSEAVRANTAPGIPSDIGVRDEPGTYNKSINVDDVDLVSVRKVKIRLNAGVTGYSVDDVLLDNGKPIFFRRDFMEKRGWKPENLIALKVTGSSMEPGLYEDDTVVVNTAETMPLDGEVYAVNYEGEKVIKRLRRDEGRWWLSSDHPDKRRYPDKVCHEQTIIVGRVIHRQGERI